MTEGGRGLLPIISLFFSSSPQPYFGVGVKISAGAEGASKKLALFYLENEVYLVKIAFASENQGLRVSNCAHEAPEN